MVILPVSKSADSFYRVRSQLASPEEATRLVHHHILNDEGSTRLHLCWRNAERSDLLESYPSQGTKPQQLANALATLRACHLHLLTRDFYRLLRNSSQMPSSFMGATRATRPAAILKLLLTRWSPGQYRVLKEKGTYTLYCSYCDHIPEPVEG